MDRNSWTINTALENANIAVIATDRNGLVSCMNKAAESVTGQEAGEALGKRLSEVLRIVNESSYDDIETAFDLMEPANLNEHVIKRCILIETGGREIPIHVYISAIRNGEGDSSGRLVLFQRVPSVGEKKDSFKSMNTRSHELRTPLTIIKYALHNIGNDPGGSLSDNQLRNLEMALNNLRRLMDLIDGSF
ncbi:MAG: PAS domain-containing protein [Candidatus Glassbacteria bacterium]